MLESIYYHFPTSDHAEFGAVAWNEMGRVVTMVVRLFHGCHGISQRERWPGPGSQVDGTRRHLLRYANYENEQL